MLERWDMTVGGRKEDLTFLWIIHFAWSVWRTASILLLMLPTILFHIKGIISCSGMRRTTNLCVFLVITRRLRMRIWVGGTRPKVYNDPTSCIKHRSNCCHFRFDPTPRFGSGFHIPNFRFTPGGVLENQLPFLNLVLPLGGVLENRLPILNLVLTPPSVFRGSIWPHHFRLNPTYKLRNSFWRVVSRLYPTLFEVREILLPHYTYWEEIYHDYH